MKAEGWIKRGQADKAAGKEARCPENIHYMKGYLGERAKKEEPVDLDRIKAMLEKLQALASHKATGKEEAANAMAKMQAILLKYNLDMSDVELKKDDIVDQEFTFSGSSCERMWRNMLHQEIAVYNFCRSIAERGKNLVNVVGKKHNIEAVNYMYEYISKTIWRLAKEAAEAKSMGLSGRYTFLNSFAAGASIAVSKRLKAEREAAVKVSDCRALVVQQDALVVRKYEQLYPNTHTAKSSAGVNADGFMKGKAAGEKMALNKGISKAPAKAAVA